MSVRPPAAELWSSFATHVYEIRRILGGENGGSVAGAVPPVRSVDDVGIDAADAAARLAAVAQLCLSPGTVADTWPFDACVALPALEAAVGAPSGPARRAIAEAVAPMLGRLIAYATNSAVFALGGQAAGRSALPVGMLRVPPSALPPSAQRSVDAARNADPDADADAEADEGHTSTAAAALHRCLRCATTLAVFAFSGTDGALHESLAAVAAGDAVVASVAGTLNAWEAAASRSAAEAAEPTRRFATPATVVTVAGCRAAFLALTAPLLDAAGGGAKAPPNAAPPSVAVLRARLGGAPPRWAAVFPIVAAAAFGTATRVAAAVAAAAALSSVPTANDIASIALAAVVGRAAVRLYGGLYTLAAAAEPGNPACPFAGFTVALSLPTTPHPPTVPTLLAAALTFAKVVPSAAVAPADQGALGGFGAGRARGVLAPTAVMSAVGRVAAAAGVAAGFVAFLARRMPAPNFATAAAVCAASVTAVEVASVVIAAGALPPSRSEPPATHAMFGAPAAQAPLGGPPRREKRRTVQLRRVAERAGHASDKDDVDEPAAARGMGEDRGRFGDEGHARGKKTGGTERGASNVEGSSGSSDIVAAMAAAVQPLLCAALVLAAASDGAVAGAGPATSHAAVLAVAACARAATARRAAATASAIAIRAFLASEAYPSLAGAQRRPFVGAFFEAVWKEPISINGPASHTFVTAALSALGPSAMFASNGPLAALRAELAAAGRRHFSRPSDAAALAEHAAAIGIAVRRAMLGIAAAGDAELLRTLAAFVSVTVRVASPALASAAASAASEGSQVPLVAKRAARAVEGVAGQVALTIETVPSEILDAGRTTAAAAAVRGAITTVLRAASSAVLPLFGSDGFEMNDEEAVVDTASGGWCDAERALTTLAWAMAGGNGALHSSCGGFALLRLRHRGRSLQATALPALPAAADVAPTAGRHATAALIARFMAAASACMDSRVAATLPAGGVDAAVAAMYADISGDASQAPPAATAEAVVAMHVALALLRVRAAHAGASSGTGEHVLAVAGVVASVFRAAATAAANCGSPFLNDFWRQSAVAASAAGLALFDEEEERGDASRACVDEDGADDDDSGPDDGAERIGQHDADSSDDREGDDGLSPGEQAQATARDEAAASARLLLQLLHALDMACEDTVTVLPAVATAVRTAATQHRPAVLQLAHAVLLADTARAAVGRGGGFGDHADASAAHAAPTATSAVAASVALRQAFLRLADLRPYFVAQQKIGALVPPLADVPKLDRPEGESPFRTAVRSRAIAWLDAERTAIIAALSALHVDPRGASDVATGIARWLRRTVGPALFGSPLPAVSGGNAAAADAQGEDDGTPVFVAAAVMDAIAAMGSERYATAVAILQPLFSVATEASIPVRHLSPVFRLSRGAVVCATEVLLGAGHAASMTLAAVNAIYDFNKSVERAHLWNSDYLSVISSRVCGRNPHDFSQDTPATLAAMAFAASEPMTAQRRDVATWVEKELRLALTVSHGLGVRVPLTGIPAVLARFLVAKRRAGPFAVGTRTDSAMMYTNFWIARAQAELGQWPSLAQSMSPLAASTALWNTGSRGQSNALLLGSTDEDGNAGATRINKRSLAAVTFAATALRAGLISAEYAMRTASMLAECLSVGNAVHCTKTAKQAANAALLCHAYARRAPPTPNGAAAAAFACGNADAARAMLDACPAADAILLAGAADRFGETTVLRTAAAVIPVRGVASVTALCRLARCVATADDAVQNNARAVTACGVAAGATAMRILAAAKRLAIGSDAASTDALAAAFDAHRLGLALEMPALPAAMTAPLRLLTAASRSLPATAVLGRRELCGRVGALCVDLAARVAGATANSQIEAALLTRALDAFVTALSLGDDRLREAAELDHDAGSAAASAGLCFDNWRLPVAAVAAIARAGDRHASLIHRFAHLAFTLPTGALNPAGPQILAMAIGAPSPALRVAAATVIGQLADAEAAHSNTGGDDTARAVVFAVAALAAPRAPPEHRRALAEIVLRARKSRDAILKAARFLRALGLLAALPTERAMRAVRRALMATTKTLATFPEPAVTSPLDRQQRGDCSDTRAAVSLQLRSPPSVPVPRGVAASVAAAQAAWVAMTFPSVTNGIAATLRAALPQSTAHASADGEVLEGIADFVLPEALTPAETAFARSVAPSVADVATFVAREGTAIAAAAVASVAAASSNTTTAEFSDAFAARRQLSEIESRLRVLYALVRTADGAARRAAMAGRVAPPAHPAPPSFGVRDAQQRRPPADAATSGANREEVAARDAAAAAARKRWMAVAFVVSVERVSPLIHALLCSTERVAAGGLLPNTGHVLLRAPRAFGFESSTVDATGTEIMAVSDAVAVLATKARPRVVQFLRWDGVSERWLVKGLEDCRVDARAQQWLAVADASLAAAPDSRRTGLRVATYDAVPLGPEGGLLRLVGQRENAGVSAVPAPPIPPLFALVAAHYQRTGAVLSPVAPTQRAPDRRNTTRRAVAARDFSSEESSDDGGASPENEGDAGDSKDEDYEEVPRYNPGMHFHWVSRTIAPSTATSAGASGSLASPLTPASPHSPLTAVDDAFAARRAVVLALMREAPRDVFSRSLVLGAPFGLATGEAPTRTVVETVETVKANLYGPLGWYVRQRAFAASLGAASAAGYALGLGDRHLDNILCDWTTGSVLHVDFNVVFERGRRLRVPETVPFRLTPLLQTALGPLGPQSGPFAAALATSLGTFAGAARPTLLSLLALSFGNDPLAEWAAPSGGGPMVFGGFGAGVGGVATTASVVAAAALAALPASLRRAIVADTKAVLTFAASEVADGAAAFAAAIERFAIDTNADAVAATLRAGGEAQAALAVEVAAVAAAEAAALPLSESSYYLRLQADEGHERLADAAQKVESDLAIVDASIRKVNGFVAALAREDSPLSVRLANLLRQSPAAPQQQQNSRARGGAPAVSNAAPVVVSSYITALRMLQVALKCGGPVVLPAAATQSCLTAAREALGPFVDPSVEYADSDCDGDSPALPSKSAFAACRLRMEVLLGLDYHEPGSDDGDAVGANDNEEDDNYYGSDSEDGRSFSSQLDDFQQPREARTRVEAVCAQRYGLSVSPVAALHATRDACNVAAVFYRSLSEAGAQTSSVANLSRAESVATALQAVASQHGVPFVVVADAASGRGLCAELRFMPNSVDGVRSGNAAADAHEATGGARFESRSDAGSDDHRSGGEDDDEDEDNPRGGGGRPRSGRVGSDDADETAHQAAHAARWLPTNLFDDDDDDDDEDDGVVGVEHALVAESSSGLQIAPGHPFAETAVVPPAPGATAVTGTAATAGADEPLPTELDFAAEAAAVAARACLPCRDAAGPGIVSALAAATDPIGAAFVAIVRAWTGDGDADMIDATGRPPPAPPKDIFDVVRELAWCLRGSRLDYKMEEVGRTAIIGRTALRALARGSLDEVLETERLAIAESAEMAAANARVGALKTRRDAQQAAAAVQATSLRGLAAAVSPAHWEALSEAWQRFDTNAVKPLLAHLRTRRLAGNALSEKSGSASGTTASGVPRLLLDEAASAAAEVEEAAADCARFVARCKAWAAAIGPGWIELSETAVPASVAAAGRVARAVGRVASAAQELRIDVGAAGTAFEVAAARFAMGGSGGDPAVVGGSAKHGDADSSDSLGGRSVETSGNTSREARALVESVAAKLALREGASAVADRLITEATSLDRLVSMFEGWAPWL